MQEQLLEVFGIPMDEVTESHKEEMQKAVNFGIIYGLSAFGLSQDLKISRKQAQEYIDRYFAMYPRVKGILRWGGGKRKNRRICKDNVQSNPSDPRIKIQQFHAEKLRRTCSNEFPDSGNSSRYH